MALPYLLRLCLSCFCQTVYFWQAGPQTSSHFCLFYLAIGMLGLQVCAPTLASCVDSGTQTQGLRSAWPACFSPLSQDCSPTLVVLMLLLVTVLMAVTSHNSDRNNWREDLFLFLVCGVGVHGPVSLERISCIQTCVVFCSLRRQSWGFRLWLWIVRFLFVLSSLVVALLSTISIDFRLLWLLEKSCQKIMECLFVCVFMFWSSFGLIFTYISFLWLGVSYDNCRPGLDGTGVRKLLA